MRNPIIILKSVLILFIGTSLFSCNNSEKKDKKVVKTILKEEDSFNAEMAAINAETAISGKTITSLRYAKEDGSSIVAQAHLSEKDVVMRIDEEYNNGNGKDFGKISYYMKDGKIFLTKEYFEDHSVKDIPKFVDRISYYSKDEKVEKTVEKRAELEEQLILYDYEPCALKQLSIKRARKILNQEGEYAITFQGFVNANAIYYLIVGENKTDGFTSALRVDYDDQFIKMLLKNEKQLIGKKIKVGFENITDNSGFQFQAYLGGELLD
jgi:hypothetical protein